ncbi:PLP-dependent aminotransferase family protein [Actinopolymorpha alba]|uniref:aminotransferase-like domain-containing protein n=1 Tax=Actinopolymorpha alba TaxID=533267 RepID=UPI000381CC62|nr:PLP-dependent aminotransferase family protein [Actinopolymorpha alba]
MGTSSTRSNPAQVVYIGAPRLTRLLDGWGDQPGGLSTRLAEALRQLVRSGQLPAGTRLPSERVLASALGLGRTTVGQAFDTLRATGVLISRTGSGTFVSTAAFHAPARGDDRLRSFVTSPFGSGGPSTGHPTARIDLRSAALPGIPMVAEELDRLTAADFIETLPSHGYVPRGLPVLRTAVANYYTALGLRTEPGQILVTSGAQQAMRILAETLIEPGGTVVVEEPTFRGAIEVLRSVGAHLVGVPSGRDGVDIDALAATVRTHRPVFALLQSTVHNPTGSVLPEWARAAVARLSAETGLTIVDDAAPTDAIIDGPLPPPLASYGGRVLTLGSASKGFWGGLRVGWLRADRRLVERLAVVKGAEDLGTSIPAQVVTARLLNRAAEARAHRRATLSVARELALQILADELPTWRPYTPAGGASLWIGLPKGHSATTFAERAGRAGVDVLAGPTFSCQDVLDGWLRVAFAVPQDVVASGLHRLAELWHAGHDGAQRP